MLTVQNIETHYGASQALFGISMNVRNGEVVTLIGRNGMGKTTSINSIMGITPITRGNIIFENVRIEHLESFKINRKGIALVPEGRQVFPNLTVRENLVAISANRNNHTSPWNLNKILDLFPQLSARIDSMANLLSGGEQQMLAIGRSLMTNPKLLLLDEATEGLAPLVRNEIWRCLNKLKKEGISMLVVDKNIKDLARVADMHYVIEKGQIVWQGNSNELLNHKDYLGNKLGV
ncbi:MAG: ABC transporter ATP-binding protein [Pseudomonadota bacterium]|nr:ABC transporter ATP-binding protein [Pseudomonadota bacterium]MEE3006921.1 ABC transporter ATP-binding protein [Pseudomonadota bacterium]GIR52845.1 MAG: ABC transporter ATP-binding protein [Rhodospirillaceae bacterium]